MQSFVNGIIMTLRFVRKFLIALAFSFLALFLFMFLIVGIGTSTSNSTPPVPVIFDVLSVARITESELVSKLGEPQMRDPWTHKTSKGDFSLVNYDYYIGDMYYTFLTHEGVVVKMYADVNNGGDSLPYEGDYKHIFKQFGITPKSSIYPSVNTGVTLKFDNPAEGIERFEVHAHNPDNKTFGMVRATFDMRFFD